MEQIKKTVIEEYWLKKLSGELPVISLPLIHDAKNENTAKSQALLHFQLNIPGELTVKLKKIAKNSDIGLFILFLSALNIGLYRYTDIEDLIVGTLPPAMDGNDWKDRNMLFCRNRVSSSLTVKEVINQTKQEVIEALNYSEFSLDRILAELQVINNSGSLNIFNVAFIYDAHQVENRYLDRFDLVFTLSESNTQIVLAVKYPPSPDAGKMVERFSRNVLHLLDGMVENPGQEMERLDVVTVEEKQQLLNEFNDTLAEYPRDKTINRLLEEQVERSPDHIAVVGAAALSVPLVFPVCLTYRELNERSGRLAQVLREKGVLSDNIVGIKIERSVEMIVGIIGILKSGGAYLPIDPEYPEARIDYILKDSSAKLLVTTNEKEGEKLRRWEGEKILLEYIIHHSSHLSSHHSSFIIHHSNHLAYVIYTSGSTGRPKGVMIENQSVMNFIKGITDIIPFQESDRILSLTTISFDIFGLETILPLTKGSVVIIGSAEEQQDTGLWALAINREAITIFQATPSRLKLFIQSTGSGGNLKRLKYLLVGGEIFPEALLAKLKQLTDGYVYNVYGPTETTIWSTIKVVSGGNILNIGKPLANTFIYMLSRGGLLQPVGGAGEIYISGEGVARGYINLPELTKEKFQGNPFVKGKRLYCTGDIGRWLPDGNIECLGRIDHQVKVRGFRIELGEIETQLLEHEGIKEAVVLFKENAGAVPALFAYIVAEKEFNVAQLREYLAGELPDYMIPAHFMQIEKIPLTPNGKVDRKALELLAKRIDTGAAYVAPQNEIERKITGIWQEVLNRDKIGIHDNYFEVGGTSFDIIRINDKLREVFQVEIPVVSMFRYTTVHLLAEYLNPNDKKQDPIAGPRDRSAALERGKMDRRQRLQKRQEAWNG